MLGNALQHECDKARRRRKEKARYLIETTGLLMVAGEGLEPPTRGL